MIQNITLLQIINNHEKLYDGKDLTYYAKKVFFARNTKKPYHNFRHMMHVTVEVYDAIKTLKIDPIHARYLLIAAMFHDYGHTGDGQNSDTVNIRKAIEGIKRHIHRSDKKNLDTIVKLITGTMWLGDIGEIITEDNLFINILRDADISQTFSNAWIQQVIFGLGQEKGMSPREMIHAQIPFLKQLKFSTTWGQKKFIPLVADKIKEIEAWKEILLSTNKFKK